MRKHNNRGVIRKRFYRAMLQLQQHTGCNAKELAAQYNLPHRSVLNWLRGKTSPGPRRSKELCSVFGWQYESLFESEAQDERFEKQHLDLGSLNRHYLSLQPRNPLEAWAYVALAGAIVFVDLSAAGFECSAVINHQFGTRVNFSLPRLAKVSLRIGVVFGRGLLRVVADLRLPLEKRDGVFLPHTHRIRNISCRSRITNLLGTRLAPLRRVAYSIFSRCILNPIGKRSTI